MPDAGSSQTQAFYGINSRLLQDSSLDCVAGMHCFTCRGLMPASKFRLNGIFLRKQGAGRHRLLAVPLQLQMLHRRLFARC